MLATMQASQALERAGWMPHTSRAGILEVVSAAEEGFACLLYTSPSPRD